ncbi:hypothetical protein A2U01_0087685, partial [Trifolium medium]|nr:hypothetical protein [Trifolium medium]
IWDEASVGDEIATGFEGIALDAIEEARLIEVASFLRNCSRRGL